MPGGSLGIIGWSGLRRKLLFHFVQHHLLILFPLFFSFHFHPLFYFLFCSSDSLGLFEGEVDEVFEVDGFSAVGIGEGTQVGTGIVVIAQEWRKEEVLGGRGELIHNNCSTIHTLPPKHTGSAIKPK
jgi:hypothetical protein